MSNVSTLSWHKDRDQGADWLSSTEECQWSLCGGDTARLLRTEWMVARECKQCRHSYPKAWRIVGRAHVVSRWERHQHGYKLHRQVSRKGEVNTGRRRYVRLNIILRIRGNGVKIQGLSRSRNIVCTDVGITWGGMVSTKKCLGHRWGIWGLSTLDEFFQWGGGDKVISWDYRGRRWWLYGRFEEKGRILRRLLGEMRGLT